MPLYIICLVLFAALLHASWNAMLRGGADRLWSMTIMCMAIALASLIVATLLPPPARASWFCVGLSAVLHVGYNLFLVRSYRVWRPGPDLSHCPRCLSNPDCPGRFGVRR